MTIFAGIKVAVCALGLAHNVQQTEGKSAIDRTLVVMDAQVSAPVDSLQMAGTALEHGADALLERITR